MSCRSQLSGGMAQIGGHQVQLPSPAMPTAAGKIELGIRPEYVRLGRQGMPVKIAKIEDIGRHKIVRTRLENQEIAVIVGEGQDIPAEPHIAFDPKGINIYADSWRMGGQ